MAADEHDACRSPSPKRLPDKLIQFWNQPHNSGSTVSFNHSVRGSPSKQNGSMASSIDSNTSGTSDYSPGRVKALVNESTDMILNDNNHSLDSTGNSPMEAHSFSRLQQHFSAGRDVTVGTPPSLRKTAVTPSPSVNPATEKHRTFTPGFTDDTSPNLSQLIQAWSSPHVSGATMSFNKGNSVASHETNASTNDSSQTLRGRVLFDVSTESADQSHSRSTTESFDRGETSCSFDHSRSMDTSSTKRSHVSNSRESSHLSTSRERSHNSTSRDQSNTSTSHERSHSTSHLGTSVERSHSSTSRDCSHSSTKVTESSRDTEGSRLHESSHDVSDVSSSVDRSNSDGSRISLASTSRDRSSLSGDSRSTSKGSPARASLGSSRLSDTSGSVCTNTSNSADISNSTSSTTHRTVISSVDRSRDISKCSRATASRELRRSTDGCVDNSRVDSFESNKSRLSAASSKSVAGVRDGPSNRISSRSSLNSANGNDSAVSLPGKTGLDIPSIVDSVAPDSISSGASEKDDIRHALFEGHDSFQDIETTHMSAVDMDESCRSHRLQSSEMHSSTTSAVNDEIEMDLSSFAKMQHSFLVPASTAPGKSSPLRLADIRTAKNVSGSPKSSRTDPPRPQPTPEHSPLRTKGSPSRTVASLLIDDDSMVTPNASFLLTRTLNQQKHVTFPDEVTVAALDTAPSLCDSNKSTDSSSDPSRYENSSLMMSNSILGSESSTNEDLTLDTSSKLESVLHQSIDAPDGSRGKVPPPRGILKNSSYEAPPICQIVPLVDSPENTSNGSSSRGNSIDLKVRSLSKSSPERKDSSVVLKALQTADAACDMGIAEAPAGIGCMDASVGTERPADSPASLISPTQSSPMIECNAAVESHVYPAPLPANADTSLDSAYFTPTPGQATVVANEPNGAVRQHFQRLRSAYGAYDKSPTKDFGQDSFDAFDRPLSPETIPPDDLDLTSIHSEASDGISVGNRHHLVCVTNESDHKLDSSAFFSVAAVEIDEEGQRESFSFDAGFNRECNRSNDTEHMLANVINAAQQAVSSEHPIASTRQAAKLANLHNLRRGLHALSPIMSTNGDDDGTHVHANMKAAGRKKISTDGRAGTGTGTSSMRAVSPGKPRHACEHDRANSLAPYGNKLGRMADPETVTTNEPRSSKLTNDEINESFELSSVSTLDSDKEEGQLHFWIDAFLDFVSPDDDRTVNSDDSSSTVSESVAGTRNNVSEDVSSNTRALPDAKKASRIKIKKKTASSFSRLREWWKKELIAEVMRDSASKANFEKKAKKHRDPCPKLEKLVSKEFKKVLSGERIELIGSRDSNDADGVSTRSPSAHTTDPHTQGWVESFKKTIVCGTADTLKESYKTIQHEVESFDTLDGLVQALKNSKFDSDAAAISGRFKSIYEQLQKSLVESKMFDKRAAAMSEGDAVAASPEGANQVASEHASSHEAPQPSAMDANGFLNVLPDDSLDLFMKEESSPLRVTTHTSLGDLANRKGRKLTSAKAAFVTPENSLIENSLNESRSSTGSSELPHLDAANNEPKVTLDSHLVAAAAAETQRPAVGPSNDLTHSFSQADHEISMTDFEQRKLLSESSDLSEASKSDASSLPHETSRSDFGHTTSTFDISIAVGSLPPTPEFQRDSFDSRFRDRGFKPSPDKRNLTKDTAPDISGESMNLTKLDFIHVSKVGDSKPDADLSPVPEPMPAKTKRRRSPKIHITTLSQKCGQDEESPNEEATSNPALSVDEPNQDVVVTDECVDTAEVNLTQFGEECDLLAAPLPDLSDPAWTIQNGLPFEAEPCPILPDTDPDADFLAFPEGRSPDHVDIPYPRAEENVPIAESQIPQLRSGEDYSNTKARDGQRIGSLPLLKKRLGIKSRRKGVSRAESLPAGSKPDPPLENGDYGEELDQQDTSLKEEPAKVNDLLEPSNTAPKAPSDPRSKLTVGSLLNDVEIPRFPSFHHTESEEKSESAAFDVSREMVFHRHIHRNKSDPTKSKVALLPVRKARENVMVAALPVGSAGPLPDEARNEEKTSSPEESFREWEDFSSSTFNAFATSESQSAIPEQPAPVVKTDAPPAVPTMDVYTTSASEFVSF